MTSLIAASARYERICLLAEDDSTNTTLLDAPNVADRTVLIACQQNRARGRHGRVWQCPPGSQLAFSVAYRPGRGVIDRLGLLPLLWGLGVADGIAAASGLAPGVKWPNDLLVGERKLVGLLAEARGLDRDPRVVVGVAVNHARTPVETATSLAEHAGAGGVTLPGLDALAGAILSAVADREEAWRRGANLVAQLDEYRRRCVTLGATVRVELADRTLMGVADDITDQGLLLVRDAHGRTHELSAGDVVHVRGPRGEQAAR